MHREFRYFHFKSIVIYDGDRIESCSDCSVWTLVWGSVVWCGRGSGLVMMTLGWDGWWRGVDRDWRVNVPP